MKKYILIIIGIILIIGLSLIIVFQGNGDDNGNGEQTTATTTQIPEMQGLTQFPPEELPPEEYWVRAFRPEIIYLESNARITSSLGLNFPLSYRAKYYMVFPSIIEFVTNERGFEAVNEWQQNLDENSSIEPQEMKTLSFITTFGLSRTAVKTAVNEGREVRVRDIRENGQFAVPFSELSELPNVDLLFTFNSDLINRYYSRDLVVAQEAYDELQEWLQNNEPYESYSAFRAANP